MSIHQLCPQNIVESRIIMRMCYIDMGCCSSECRRWLKYKNNFSNKKNVAIIKVMWVN